jgi:small subunit ribosomal protein S4
MANYRGPKARISRRFGTPILGCENVLKKKPYAPGQHGKKRRRQTDYARQLAEKQKAKMKYGILERQFRNIVKEASASKGVSGDRLMQLLEMRLDSVVYRFGIALTNAAARQFVVHRHVRVNNKPVDRPSYTLNKGDQITLSDKAKEFIAVKDSLASKKENHDWLSWNDTTMTGVILDIPQRKAIPESIDEKAIIEFYSR